MKVQPIAKGQPGYLAYKKKWESLKTFVFFAIPIALFIAGIVTTKSQKNLLTVVAMLGMLPACKSLVTLIVYLRCKNVSKETQQVIQAKSQNLATIYELYFTTYEVTYVVSAITICGNTVVGYCENPGTADAATSYLSEMLKQNGKKQVTVKLFENLEKYLERLDSLSQMEKDGGKEVLSLLLQVAL